MRHPNAGSLSRGYAEILSADGPVALLRLHAAAAEDEAEDEHLWYAVAQHDEVVYVSAESNRASDRFKRLVHDRVSDTGSGADSEDFLATMPTRLPVIRGPAYHRLAAQVSELSRGGEAEH